MFHESGEAGLGVVIRNHEGEVMAALSEEKNPTATLCYSAGITSSYASCPFCTRSRSSQFHFGRRLKNFHQFPSER